MEFPPFHHHNHRYVPHPHPHPRPTPSTNFFDDRHLNFNPPHHHLPPPPRPPFPSPPIFPPVPPAVQPPPPPHNLHHSHFTFLNHHRPRPPIEDDSRMSRLFDFIPQSPPPKPSVSARTVFENFRPRIRIPKFENLHPDMHPDPWADPARVLPEHHQVRPFPLDYNHQPPLQQRAFNAHRPVSPYRPVDIYEHHIDRNSRLRDEFIDGLLSDNRGADDRGDNFHPVHDVYESNFDISDRNFASGVDPHNISDSITSRDYALNLGDYDFVRATTAEGERFWNNRDEERRWGHSSQHPIGELNSLLDMENNGYDNGDRAPSVAAMRDSNIYESIGFNGKEREKKQEFVRTPKKKIQRKSALLRIQLGKPSSRNRNHDHFSKACLDDSNAGTSRGKGSLGYSDNRTGGDRDGSPVELDVSFKSSGLVAKAIIAPSCPAVDSDMNITPRHRKIRKLGLSDSPQTNITECSIELNNSTQGSNIRSISDKKSQQLLENLSVSGKGNAVANCSRPCSDVTGDSAGNNMLTGFSKVTDLPQDGYYVAPNGTPSPRVRKKKKITVLSSKSNAQLIKQECQGICSDSSSIYPSAISQSDDTAAPPEEKSNSSDIVLPRDVVFLPSLTEADDNKVSESPGIIVSEDGNNNGFCGTRVPNAGKVSRNLDSILQSSGILNDKISDVTESADASAYEVKPVSQCVESLINSQSETTNVIDRADDTIQITCKDGIPSLVKNSPVKDLFAAVGLTGSGDATLSSPEKIRYFKDNVDSDMSIHSDFDVPNCEHGFVERKVTVLASNVKIVDFGFKTPSSNQVNMPVGGQVSDQFLLDSAPLVEDNVTLGSSKTMETPMNQYSPVANCCGRDLSPASSSSSGLINCLKNIANHSSCLVDDGSKLSCLGEAVVSVDNDCVDRSPKAKIKMAVSTDGNTGANTIPTISRKRKGRITQLAFSSSKTDGRCANMVTSSHKIDSTLSCTDRNLSSAEWGLIVSGTENTGIGSKICEAGDGIWNVNGFSKRFSVVEIPACVTPNFRKKRKVSEPGLFFNMLSEIHEGSTNADTIGPITVVPSIIEKCAKQLEEKVDVHRIGATGLSPCLNPNSGLLEQNDTGGSFEADLVGGCFVGDCSKFEESISTSAVVTDVNEGPFIGASTNCQSGIIDMQISSRWEDVADAHGILDVTQHSPEPVQYKLTLETQIPESNQGVATTDIAYDNYQLVADNLPSALNDQSLFAQADGISATYSGVELIDDVPNGISNMGSPENLCAVSGSHVPKLRSSVIPRSSETVCVEDRKLDKRPVSEGDSVSDFIANSLDKSKNSMGSENALVSNLSITSKQLPYLSQVSNKKPNSTKGELNLRRDHSSSNSRILLGHSVTSFSHSRQVAPSNQFGRPRTWHRTGNLSVAPVTQTKCYSSPVPPQRQSLVEAGKVMNSYIRKGNSLVRKPPPLRDSSGFHTSSSSVYRLNSSGVDELTKTKGFERKIEVIEPQNCLKMEGLNGSLERPISPVLPFHSKTLSKTTLCPRDSRSSPMLDPPNGYVIATPDILELNKNVNAPKTSEDDPKVSAMPEHQSCSSNTIEVQGAVNDGTPMKNIIYLKRKSNQLVAALNSVCLSAQAVDKTQSSSFDAYYRRRKNQLIRSSESQTMQRVVTSDGNANSDRQRMPETIPSRNTAKRQPGSAKAYKSSKFSLVWTLYDAQSSRKQRNSSQLPKAWPHLFPWKRSTYWKSFLHNSSSISSRSSLSTISWKLLLSRKRDTIYKRSSHGFSLRISKVLSVGGSSLKWSKSIERNSRKASEEATLAVAAAEKRKREQSGAARAIGETENRNHSSRKSVHIIELLPGERIFRVGSVRYKMDPSRRTLQRISDELMHSTSLQSEKNAKRSYVPRRLLIDNDEYVCIGNGNQLIRDPKRRTRMLASEKIRWSLHTARLRLAKKRKYCQFFTRFGKCNKDDGKCPYIHDPSKIAVCTKFLNGSCANSNCKLTHEVIPERMQDCSYFLQGLCSNESCPYRHVNVNPNASVCESFLKGYCADGNECRKKHTYVCPVFEATGICSQGSKCKLHHPKIRKKGLRRKPLRGQNNIRSRYFGPGQVDIFGCRIVVPEKHSMDEDILFQEGKFADYISLDVSDEEAGETNDLTNEPRVVLDSDPSESHIADLDELIKPVRIMNKNLMGELSPMISSSPSEMIRSYVSEESNSCNSMAALS